MRLPTDCPSLDEARNGLLSPLDAPSPGSTSFDEQRLPYLIAFLGRTGLGFGKAVHDRCSDESAEIKDRDVGSTGGLALDLDL